jgi:hypothetical protein
VAKPVIQTSAFGAIAWRAKIQGETQHGHSSKGKGQLVIRPCRAMMHIGPILMEPWNQMEPRLWFHEKSRKVIDNTTLFLFIYVMEPWNQENKRAAVFCEPA